MENWIHCLLQQKQIKNYSCKNLLETLGESIHLEDYDLISVGYDSKKEHKKITYFRIVKHFPHKAILQGPHEILIYTDINHLSSAYKFWVYSLTRLRLVFFKMNDRLSFERSTFLVDRTHHRIIRLKNIRDKIILPLIWNQERVDIFISPSQSIRSNFMIMKKTENFHSFCENFSELTEKQLYHQMEMFWIMYVRHKDHFHCLRKEECKYLILQYFETFLKQI
jgi:hypothetical protein